MNEQAFFQLSQDAVSRLAERYGTPLLVLSLEQIEKIMTSCGPISRRMRIHYAMKANPDLRILETMIDKNADFDVASDGEIRTLASLGVPGER